MDPTRRDTISDNLRQLVVAHGNISAVCRNLHMNRQQFNKYLSGRHTPSQSNINAICRYFGISSSDLTDPDFDPAGTHSPSRTQDSFSAAIDSPIFAHLLEAHDSGWVEQFCGIYEKYHFSSIYKGDVVRSILKISPARGVCTYSNYEIFPNRRDPEKVEFLFRYHGIVFGVEQRLFLIDFEKIQRNELTFSIFAPLIRKPTRFFFGVTSGVAANLGRAPYCSKAVLDFRGDVPVSKSLVRRATVLPPDDHSIPLEASDYLMPR
ncbi:helix-turn-helix transcriptional regulator [Nitratireductor sp. ZSWI3]|uniref:helix-turn-helix domain-containing protein n=1 Tax=Nitratireductor sp. ZSWI3 TaxID=2966359 RepID=UPI0021504FFA|nr:helix-turn-helix transcriptional regulator [Nitratireductor sp. ZSWI3]MCR4265826.1 helix-turn-helix domain-containing protein [Nitratireductor sp. ZSWI3]